MTAGLQRIDHINIVVKDLEEVCRFFVSLGFNVADRARLQGEWISKTVGLKEVDADYVKLALPDDGAALELIQYRTPPSLEIPDPGKANTQGLRHLAFRVDDIEATVSALKSKGIDPVSSIQEYRPANKRLVYFKGPEEILLELAQYGTPPAKASGT